MGGHAGRDAMIHDLAALIAMALFVTAIELWLGALVS
jgi:hypothetical protein